MFQNVEEVLFLKHGLVISQLCSYRQLPTITDNSGKYWQIKANKNNWFRFMWNHGLMLSM